MRQRRDFSTLILLHIEQHQVGIAMAAAFGDLADQHAANTVERNRQEGAQPYGEHDRSGLIIGPVQAGQPLAPWERQKIGHKPL